MYFVIYLCDDAIVGEAPDYNTASILLADFINESDGFYTEDDLTIMDEAELEDYGLMN